MSYLMPQEFMVHIVWYRENIEEKIAQLYFNIFIYIEIQTEKTCNLVQYLYDDILMLIIHIMHNYF